MAGGAVVACPGIRKSYDCLHASEESKTPSSEAIPRVDRISSLESGIPGEMYHLVQTD